MGKIAIPIWQDRVSPVLDSARTLVIIDVDGDEVVSREMLYLPQTSLSGRVDIMSERGVDILLCGALSRSLNDLLTRAGIEVYAWITGDLDQVLAAYRRGDLNQEQFFLPGCGRGRRNRGFRRGGGRCRGRSRMNLFKED